MAKVYTYKNIQDEVLRYIDEDVNTSPATLTLVKNCINQAHLRRLSNYDWWFMLWPYPITFSTTINQQNYALHSEFYKGYYFFNQTTKAYLIEENGRMLGPSGVRWGSDQGHATRFAFWGRSPVSAQLPAAGSLVTIISSSALDTGSAYAVTIKGTDSSGLGLISETINPNGTSPVSSSNVFYNPILNITIAQAFNGTLSVVSGSTSLLTLKAGEFGRSYPQIYLLSVPNASDVIEYRFYRQPSNLVNDNDIPDIPPPFSQILVWDALIMIAAYNETENENVAVWAENSRLLEEQMIRANDESNTLESEPRYIRYLGEEPDAPRIYTT